MYSRDDLMGLHGFLRATAEGGLRKMLVGGKMTENHLKLLLKVVRGVGDNDFANHWEASTFPKVKMTPAEIAIKEEFWKVCGEACSKVGLLSQQKAA